MFTVNQYFILFNGWLIFHCMDNTTLCFPIPWLVVISTSWPLQIFAYNFFYGNVFSILIGNIFSFSTYLQVWIAGSYGNSVFVLRNCQTVFQSSYTYQQRMRVLVSPHPHQRLLFCLFDYSYLSVCEVVSHWGFDLHFPNNWWCWAPFHVFISCIFLFFFFFLRNICSHPLLILKSSYMSRHEFKMIWYTNADSL